MMGLGSRASVNGRVWLMAAPPIFVSGWDGV